MSSPIDQKLARRIWRGRLGIWMFDSGAEETVRVHATESGMAMGLEIKPPEPWRQREGR